MSTVILGDGLLGKEIQKQTGWDCISRKKDGIDFKDINTYIGRIHRHDTVINCIANTDTYSPAFQEHWETNYLGVIQLTDYCRDRNIKLVHISSDFIYASSPECASEVDIPVHNANWYSYTKLVADAYVQAVGKNYLLIRTSFKPKPFPYPKALTSIFGNFDYVDVISKLIIELINKGARGIYNVGTEEKTIYDLAIRTNDDVTAWYGMLHPTMPTNVTMNLNKMRRFLSEN